MDSRKIKIFRTLGACANGARRRMESISVGNEYKGTQSKILYYLLTHDNEEIYQKDIENEFDLRNPTVSEMLKKLENNGLVKRVQSEKDMRYKSIKPTEKALGYKNQVLSDFDKFIDSMLDGISEKELEQFSKTLNTILENLSKETR